MHAHTRLGLAAATLGTTAALLAGCSLLGLAEPEEEDTAENDALAVKFVACLTDEGQTAKIVEGGMVAMLLPDDFGGPDGEFSVPDPGDGEAGGGGPTGMTMVMQDDEGAWQASSAAEGYPEDGGMRDAWAACEEKVPDFEQPEPDFEQDPETQAEQMEKALAFSECARDNGFTDFPDPDEQGGMNLPEDITEDGFRQLLEDCWEAAGPMGFAISKETADKLDFDLMAVMQDFMEAHPELGPGGTGGVTGVGPSPESGE